MSYATDKTQSPGSTKAVGATDAEDQVTAVVVQMAQVDIRSLDAISKLLPASWQRTKASIGRTVGWVDHEAKDLSAEPWFLSATHETYVEAGMSSQNSPVVTSARLSLELRGDVCFSGESLNDRYLRASLGELRDSQPNHGGGYVTPLSIADKRVRLEEHSDRKCVRKIVFMWPAQ